MSLSPRTLIVAPYVGEFGWELMNWQGRVRWIFQRGGFDRVVVFANADRRALYHGVTTEMCPVGMPDLPGEANEDHRVRKDGTRISAGELRAMIEPALQEAIEAYGICERDSEYLWPDFNGRLWPTTGQHQVFANLRRPSTVVTDVVLVTRQRRIADERNQPEEWWGELTRRLTAAGLVVERSQSTLDEAIAQFSRARLAVGASTGGLHLASLCRCPHYVWGCDSSARWTGLRMSNRQRYETFWNPLGTPVRYDECGWRPEVEHVFRQVLAALHHIGRVPGVFDFARRINPAWRVRRTLGRIVQEGGMWPWRVRRLVQETLL